MLPVKPVAITVQSGDLLSSLSHSHENFEKELIGGLVVESQTMGFHYPTN